MNDKSLEPTSRRKAVRFILLIISLGLPFVFQKMNLDATRGDWRPDLANYSARLILPSLILPFVAIYFLSVSWKDP